MEHIKTPRKSCIKNYPKMNKLKSKINQYRQIVLDSALKKMNHIYKNQALINDYISGMYAAVNETHQTDFEIKGKIPNDLNGILLRSGPNPLEVPNPQLHHWFMGDGMLHGLKIQDGQAVWFKSKYIETDTVQKHFQKQTKPGFRRGPGDVVNTNAFLCANKIWAMVEAGTYPVRLDFDLNTEYHGLLNTDADLPFTAHPHVDPNTGHIHAICYDALDLRHVYYEAFDEGGNLLQLAKIPVQHGVMIHDCAITYRDILIFDFPVTFSPKKILTGHNFPYAWNEKHAARIGVLPLYGKSEQVEWIALDPCFVFHAANAFRDANDDIVLDVVVHDHMFKTSEIGPLEKQNIRLERWIVDTKTKKIQQLLIDENAQEFPRIDERWVGQKHRYIYSAGFDSLNPNAANKIYVHDLISKNKSEISLGNDWILGEAVFVPIENKEPQYTVTKEMEGNGYLLFYAHHRDLGPSKVCIYRIQGLNLKEQAEILLKTRVPLGFHCSWADLTKV